MTQIFKGYKVIRNTVSGYKSLIADPDCASTYQFQQWIYATHGPLMVFDNYTSAQNFGGYVSRQIHPTRYVPMVPKNNFILKLWESWRGLNANDVLWHWTHTIERRGDRYQDPPLGTAFAAAVYLGIGNTTPPDQDALDLVYKAFGKDQYDD